MSILEAEVTSRLDAAGNWRARLPLTDKRTSEATVGRYFLQTREGEGFVFGGIIENVQKTPEDTLELSGPTLLGELLYKNTLLNRQYTGTINAAIDSLLTLASNWSRNGSNTTTIDARFDGESVLKALLFLIDQPRIHLRELITESGGVLTKKVDIGAFGDSSGVTLSNGNPDEAMLDDPALAVVEHLDVLETVQEVWNWLIPLGAGEGESQITIQHQTRIPNLLSNFSFESDLSSWTTSGPGTVAYSTVQALKPGNGSALLTSAAGGATQMKQEVAATAGRIYQTEVWVYPTAGSLRFTVEYLDAGSGSLGFSTDDSAGTNAWEKLAITSTAPALTATIRVQVEVLAGAGGANTGYADWAIALWQNSSYSYYPVTVLDGSGAKLMWILQDATSITTYGQRERPIVAKDIAPLSNTKAALQAAANALYDVATKQLIWWKDKQTAYRLTVRGLSRSVKPGDKARLRYRGYAEHWGTGYVYLNVDTELWVLERTRRFFNDGTEQSDLVVSDLDRQLQSSTEIVIGKLEDTARTFRTRVQTSVSNRTWGPFGKDVDASNPFAFTLTIRNNVTQLLRCLIKITPVAIRSSATGAASGGSSAPTSSSVSTPSGGGSTSGSTATASGGGSTSGATGTHSHVIGSALGGFGAWGDPDRIMTTTWKGGSGSTHANMRIGKVGTEGDTESTWVTQSDPADHQHTTPDHTHPSHDHTTPAHTHPAHDHTVTISSHTHTQTYGIFESTSPAGMTLTINSVSRTTDLGGPWNAATEEDVTPYLLDSDGVVVQGDHTFSIGSTQLGHVLVEIDITEVVQAIVAS